MLGHAIDYIRKHTALILLILPAFILQMLVMMPSGSNICMNGHCGYHFWGIHSHDSMWHLEIAAVAFKSYPFLVPTFAGSVLSGYNILMDLIVFVISLAGIPPIIMLFKIVPIIWFVLYTLIAITFSQKLKDELAIDADIPDLSITKEL